MGAAYYQAKVERALAAASARGDAAAAAARDVTPATAADSEREDAAAAEAYVRGWADALDSASDAPPTHRGAQQRSTPAPGASPAPGDASAESGGSATFYFDVLSEGAFGSGVRPNEADPSQPRGSQLSNMGQFAYGELKCVRDAADDVAAGGSEEDDDEPDPDEEEAAEWEDVGDDTPYDDDEQVDEAQDEEEEEEDDDDSGSEASDDSARAGAGGVPSTRRALAAPRGAHPLFQPPTPEMRPTLSPFLMVRWPLAIRMLHFA